MFSVILSAGVDTVTVQDAVNPFDVFAVIVAVPDDLAVTVPFETDATELLDDVHVTLRFVALSGRTVAFSADVSPFFRSNLVGLTVMPVTLTVCTLGAVTVTVHFAVSPFDVFTVIVAVPAFLAVTVPLLTLATDALSDDQVTVLSVVFEGVMVAVNEAVSPAVMVSEDLFSVTFVASIGFTLGFNVKV